MRNIYGVNISTEDDLRSSSLSETTMQINKLSTIDPSEFEYVGMYYFGRSDAVASMFKDDHEELALVTGSVSGQNWNASGVVKFHANGGCATCGTNHSYGSVWKHVLTNEMFGIGNICASDKFDMPDVISMKRRKAEKALKNARVKAAALEDYNYILNSTTGLENALSVPNDFIQDVARRFQNTGYISKRQLEVVYRIAKEAYDMKAPPAPPAPKVAVPETTERVLVAGKVISTKWVDSDFGGSLRMLVEVTTPDGTYRLFGGVASTLRNAEDENFERILKPGCEVSFMAKVVRSDDDESFGFWNRPTKAKFL